MEDYTCLGLAWNFVLFYHFSLSMQEFQDIFFIIFVNISLE